MSYRSLILTLNISSDYLSSITLNVSSELNVPFRLLIYLSFFCLFSSLNSRTFDRSVFGPKTSVFYLSKLTLNSDVPFSFKEFKYLTGLKEGSFVSPKDLEQAYNNLKLKNRFENIDVDVFEDTFGKRINFKLSGFWLFRKLAFRGVWFGKYKYEDLYLQQPGDVFDVVLHEKSIEAITKDFRDNGYFNCVIEDEFIYEKKRKTICIRLNIKKKRCFKINKIDFNLIRSNKGEEAASKGEKLCLKLKRKFAKGLIGASYSRRDVSKLVQHIKIFLRKKGYLHCRVKLKRLIDNNTKCVELDFLIKLGRRVVLTFRGNNFLSTSLLKEKIIGGDLPSWLLSSKIIADRLLYEYYKKGYWGAKVKYRISNDQQMLFDISEGKAIKIDRVQIVNMNKELVSDSEKFFRELLINKSYDKDLLSSGLEQLKKHYKSSGYWNFKVTGTKIEKSLSRENYIVKILIDEGKLYFYGDVVVNNYIDLDNNIVFKKQPSDKGDLLPFNAMWLSEQRMFLIKYFQKRGYWFVSVSPDIKFEKVLLKKGFSVAVKPKSHKVFVSWNIKLGEKVRFGKVLLKGSTKLPFKTIFKELRFKEGEDWSKEKIDLSINRLKNLDLFKSINLQPYKSLASKTLTLNVSSENISSDSLSEESKYTKSIILNLIDDDTFESRFRLGYFLTSKNFLFKRQSTYKVGTSLIVRNPTNSADKLLCNVDWTRFERRLDIDYQIPSLFNLSVMSKFKIYANKYVHPVQIGESDSAYEAEQNGFLFSFNNEYRRNYFWGVNIGEEWMKTSRVRGNLNFSEDLIDKTIPVFFLEPSIIIDRRDDKINVTKGSLSFFSIKYMIPSKFKQITFRLMFEQSFFYPVYKSTVLGIRFRWGHIFRDKFEYVMPVERFYLGGPYSVRGYEKDALPPLGVSYDVEDKENILTNYTIQGGGSMLNGNCELRIPIYKSFWGVLFQDIGVLSQSGFSGFKGRWYPASGFGFRYKTPIGALRFDIGWKWKKRLPGDSSYAWYLTLGEAF